MPNSQAFPSRFGSRTQKVASEKCRPLSLWSADLQARQFLLDSHFRSRIGVRFLVVSDTEGRWRSHLVCR